MFMSQWSVDEALRHLSEKSRRFVSTQPDRKFPTRAYVCDGCGAWHLTSKPLVERELAGA